jgi:hypothetical protein
MRDMAWEQRKVSLKHLKTTNDKKIEEKQEKQRLIG